ncbi:MAG: penicillin-binding protein 1C [Neisseriaceae bacterium]
MNFILKIFKYLLIFFLSIYVVIWGLIVFTPKPKLLEDVKFSRTVFDDQKHLLHLTLTPDEQYRLYTPISDMPPNLIKAALLQEDNYYYYHPGINPIALIKAFIATYILKERKIGASTISMQVARIKNKSYTKNIPGKIMQIFYAMRLEYYYSKNEILEGYLNLAPYGGNIQGAGAASLIYFGKPISSLNMPEILTLTVIPQNPLKRVPNSLKPKYLLKARHNFFLRWEKEYPNSFNQTQLMLLKLPLQLEHNTPFLAPHFTTSVLAYYSQYNNLYTTLNLKLQKVITKIASTYSKTNNIHNYAVLLVDTRDMGVKAMLGSADFFNSQIKGQVNGTQRKRSPGSILKPFIYALALQQGLIHPLSILKDAPANFGNYSPENFDRDYVGPINATSALTTSRNIPAITLMTELKNPTFYQFLQQSHIGLLKPESKYGLSLALGGEDITMQEAATLYAMLANRGILRPLRFLQTESSVQGNRLLSPEASFLVLDMLKSNPRPDMVSTTIKESKLPVYWKTGTSSRYRDAWSVGIFGPYVLAVWVGDFTNKSFQQFIGLEVAAPLFFRIIDSIEAQTNKLNDIKDNPVKLNLVRTKICKASGRLPTPLCQRTEDTWFIPGVSPIKRDNVFREVLIDTRTGLRACRVSPTTKFVIYEFWPSDLEELFRKAGIQHPMPPPYSAGCDLPINFEKELSPRIISPRASLVYSIHAVNEKSSTIPLMAIADSDVKTIYWFANQNFIGKSLPSQSINWLADSGTYTLRAVDDHGLSDVVSIKVELVK